MDVFNLSEKDRFLLSATSQGNQSKWYVNNRFIKANMLGYEDIAESICSDVLRCIDGMDFVDYFMCEINETTEHGVCKYTGCYSYDFKEEVEEAYSVAQILNLACPGWRGRILDLTEAGLAKFVCDTIKEATGLDIYNYLGRMFRFDAIVLNEDRHLNNILVVRNALTGEYKPAPIFDNGASLLADTFSYKSISDCKRVPAKPFSTNFVRQCSFFDCEPLVIDYVSLFKRLRCRDLCGSELEKRQDEYDRAIDALFLRLELLEDTIWVRKE